MKKLLSAILCAAMGASLFVPAYAETDAAMEKSLAAVKEKIEIPAELTVFRAGKTGVDEKSYSFSWTDEEGESRIYVEADSEGRISDYSRGYDINPDNKSSLPELGRDDVRHIAVDFLKKAAPELMENDSDKLILTEEYGNPSVGESWYNFDFAREKDGVAVLNNSASVSITAYKDQAFVSWCNISWDYDAVFGEAKNELENPADSYFAAFPAELRYERMYGWRAYKSSVTDTSSDVRLLYEFKNSTGYISAADGSEVEPYVEDTYRNDLSGGGAKSAMATAESATDDAGFTDEELAELDTFKNLISAAAAEKAIRALPAVGMTADMKLVNSDVYRCKTWEYREDKGIDKEKIVMRLYFTNEDRSRGLHASVDAQSGELLSLYNYSYDDEKKAQNKDAAAEIEKFIKAAAPGRLGECEAFNKEEIDTDNDWVYTALRREVNGVPYNDNGVTVSYNKASGTVQSYSLEWDEDVSSFTPADRAMDMASAQEKMLSYAPLELVYVPTKDNYVLCYGIDYSQNAAIDAVTGEQAYKDDEQERQNINYSDISGHWAENAIKALAEMGLSEPGDKFRPDEKITQEKLLRFIDSAFGGYSVWNSDSEDLYTDLIRSGLVKKDEKNPDAQVARADAFVFFIRAMGYEKIAELPGIFNCGFSDAGQIAADKLGYAAILSGLGVISGDGNAIRANDALTNAEAAAMIYNYLKTND